MEEKHPMGVGRDDLKTGNSISARNISSLVSLVILSASLLNDKNTLKQDAWLALLLGAILIAPIYLIYARTLKLFPDMGFYDIIEKLFGRVTGVIITAVMSIYSLWLCTITLFNFSEYVSLISLENTPKLVIIISLMSVAAYLSCSGINVLGRWSIIMSASLIVNLAITFLLASKALNPEYLKPVFNHSFFDILKGSLSAGAGAFGDVVLVMAIFASFKKGDSTYKAYMYGLISGALFLILLYVRNIMILSTGMIETTVYPSYTANRVIYIGTFLEHVESLTSFNLMLLGITKISLCLSATSISATKIFRYHKHKITILIAAASAITVSFFVFKSTHQIIAILRAYQPWTLPFFALLPTIVWIYAEIYTKKRHSPL